MLRLRGFCLALTAALVAVPATFAASEKRDSRKDSSAGKSTYKWVDERGVTHYGDRVPPEYAKRERAVLNRQGVEVRRLHAEMTPEQRAAEEVRQRALADRKQRDQFLLTTYTSVGDIEALRDQRVGEIASQRQAAEQYASTLNERLVGLQARAQLFAPYSTAGSARPMPDDLTEDLVRTLNELRTQRNVILSKEAEHDAVHAEFQADIERYRELTNRTLAER
jgi:hypothetical protein